MTHSTALALRWVGFLGYAALVFVASSQPIPPAYVPRIPHIDKLAHLAAYGVFAMLCFRAVWPDREQPVPFWVLVFAVGLATAYGAGMEFYQELVSRQFDWVDMASNAVGAALAAALWEPVTRRFDWLK
ncbi:MAG TPA: VanZ family protein [Planctomycetota bacterium]|nr:VanZ family protein [Planctomycetota bacterium]